MGLNMRSSRAITLWSISFTAGMLNTASPSFTHTCTHLSGGEEGEKEKGAGGERSVAFPGHTNRHDRNKIKRVGLRQNMYGPLNRELIKELKLLVLSAEHCLITHQKSHYLNSGDSFKVSP